MNKYQKKIEALRKEEEENAKEIQVNQKVINEIWREQEKTLKPLRAELNKIQSEYSAKLKPFKEKVDKAESRNHRIPFEIREIEQDREIEKSNEEGKHNVDTITAFAERHRLREYYDIEVSEKKPLKNGVQIFRIHEDRTGTTWLAFKGLSLVGVSYRRAGEHRGDQTYPYSFIEGLSIKNRLVDKGQLWYRDNDGKQHYHQTPYTYTLWVKKLETKTTFVDIPLNKDNIRALSSKCSYDSKGNQEERWS